MTLIFCGYGEELMSINGKLDAALEIFVIGNSIIKEKIQLLLMTLRFLLFTCEAVYIILGFHVLTANLKTGRLGSR